MVETFYNTEYMISKVECTCGCMVMRSNMSHHKKTKKHQLLHDLRQLIKNQSSK